MAAPPQCCCIRELLRNVLLARKGKKHHDFMGKSRHERSRGTEREGFIQKQICNQNQVRRHSQKLQENRRNQNKTVRAGKKPEIKEKGTRGEAREAGNLLQKEGEEGTNTDPPAGSFLPHIPRFSRAVLRRADTEGTQGQHYRRGAARGAGWVGTAQGGTGWGHGGGVTRLPLDTTVPLLGAGLTLQDAYSSLGSNPRNGGILPQVIPPGVVAGPALVSPRVFQGKAGYSQHTHPIGPVGSVYGDPALPSAIPQLFESLGPVDFRIPPLDLWSGVPNHITVQFKGVPRELSF